MGDIAILGRRIEDTAGPPPSQQHQERRAPGILTVSGDSPAALQRNPAQLTSDIEAAPPRRLGRLAWTSNHVKTSGRHRLAVVATGRDEAVTETAAGGVRESSRSPVRIGWLFAGQGSHYQGMTRTLRSSCGAYRRVLAKVDEAMGSAVSDTLLNNSAFADSAYSQPALFAVEYALSRFWPKPTGDVRVELTSGRPRYMWLDQEFAKPPSNKLVNHVLFGDGAWAAVLRTDEVPGLALHAVLNQFADREQIIQWFGEADHGRTSHAVQEHYKAIKQSVPILARDSLAAVGDHRLCTARRGLSVAAKAVWQDDREDRRIPRPARYAGDQLRQPDRQHRQRVAVRPARSAAPVFLDTDMVMTGASTEYSPLVHVLAAAARVLPKHPECLVAAGGGLVPRIARFDEIRPKIAIDRTVDGHLVVSAVLTDLRDLDKAGIRGRLAGARQASAGKNIELLYRLPVRIGWFGFRRALSTVHKRAELMGTFAVSSLGHRTVNGFHAHGGTAITLNLGQVRPTPIVRDGVVDIAPVLPLNLCFDHRILDGAQAAGLLADLKEELEAGG